MTDNIIRAVFDGVSGRQLTQADRDAASAILKILELSETLEKAATDLWRAYPDHAEGLLTAAKAIERHASRALDSSVCIYQMRNPVAGGE